MSQHNPDTSTTEILKDTASISEQNAQSESADDLAPHADNSANQGEENAQAEHEPSPDQAAEPQKQSQGPLPHALMGQNADEPDDSDEESGRPMTLMEHLNELRRCLTRACIAVIVCFVGCWIVVDPIFDTLVNPLLAVLPEGSHPIYTTLPEGFFTRMFIALVAGIFVASPVISYQIWSFIAPGLYEEEKKYIIPIAFLSAIFFIGGGLFCFFIVFPYVFTFFISFATESIIATPMISDYLDFVLKLLIAFGLIFEMPLFSFFLARLGIVTASGMRKMRRYAGLIIFIVAAILTPPDVVSQLLMAGPMLVLYEISILIAALFGRKKKTDSQKSDTTSDAV